MASAGKCARVKYGVPLHMVRLVGIYTSKVLAVATHSRSPEYGGAPLECGVLLRSVRLDVNYFNVPKRQLHCVGVNIEVY